MAVNFSSNDEDIINRQIELKVENSEEIYDVHEFYEIERCIEWIKSNGFTKIALQFPDELLKDAAEIALIISKQTHGDVYILGDTSYGSCCVDEIAAEHVTADAIIHYGHACLSPTNRLPVLYIFGKFSIDIENVVSEFKHFFEDPDSKVIVFCETSYVHAMGELKDKLQDVYGNLNFSRNCLPQWENKETEEIKESSFVQMYGRRISIPENETLSAYSMFYIGSEPQMLMNLMLSFNTNVFYSYDPLTKIGRQETVDVNRYLRKRYYCIERAKDAKIVGILVGTLGVSKYLAAIDHLRDLCRQAGKRPYTLVVGKLNAAKLANFPEIDAFVYVSCPESVIVDNRGYYRPIITPFEMEIACNQARNWTGEYITDFRELLPGASAYVPLSPVEEAIGDVSLITGSFRSLGCAIDDRATESDSALAMRSDMTISQLHSNAAGEHLAHRSWQGLEPRLGETAVSKAGLGMKGIASGYEGEGRETI